MPVETPGLTVTETHVALFAGLVACDRPTPAPSPTCSPWPCRRDWAGATPAAARRARLHGLRLAFHHPVRVGDTIHSRSRPRRSAAMKEGGVVVEEREILNQRGEVVQSGRLRVLVARRPSPAP